MSADGEAFEHSEILADSFYFISISIVNSLDFFTRTGNGKTDIGRNIFSLVFISLGIWFFMDIFKKKNNGVMENNHPYYFVLSFFRNF